MDSPISEDSIASSIRALAIIASRLGLDVGVEQIRRRFALDPGEPDTPTLIVVARELGLDARSLHMKFEDLPRLARTLPAILRAKDGGALILEEARTDPAKGVVAIIRDPCSSDDVVVAIDELHLTEVWEGEAIILKRRHSVSDEEQPFGLRWFAGQVFRESKIFKEIGVAAVVSTVFALTPPFAFMLVLDMVLSNNTYSTLNVLVGALLIIIVFETVLTFLRRYLTVVATTRIDGRLNLYLVEKLLKLPMSYFETNPTGRTLSKLHQVVTLRSFLIGQIFGAFIDAVPLIGIVPALLILQWRLALVAIVISVIIFLVIFAYMPSMTRLHRKVVIAEQAKWSHMTETIYGIKTIKSLALESRRRKEWDSKVAATIETWYEFGMQASYPYTFQVPLQRLVYTGCMAIGAYMVLYYQTTPGALAGGVPITAGALVAFVMLTTRLASPLVTVAAIQMDLAEVRGAIGQIASIVNVPPEYSRPNGLRNAIKGEISFKDVSFRYSPTAPFALDQVSFTVPVGTMLGIMGRSGSGKTTVTRVLQRLNSNYDGIIKIDDMDLREIDLMHLRTHIGVVPQENFLFSATIRENIAMAKPDASFADVVRAAQMSGAEEFIERLSLGYDTPLEEGATNLSGGQRQRIALARALLIDPPILILDEATSALDAESEAIVSANLKRMAKGRTVLSISHRLSMLVDCDAILVLERGKVYDLGTHEELLRRCDIYKHMWYQQNRHLDPEAADMPLTVAGSTSR